jgi:hypothetical protein
VGGGHQDAVARCVCSRGTVKRSPGGEEGAIIHWAWVQGREVGGTLGQGETGAWPASLWLGLVPCSVRQVAVKASTL